jgi:hypothetical protein
MQSKLRRRFWLEIFLASLCFTLAMLTVISREWIEALTGHDPDHHNGSLEWALVAVLLVAAVAVGAVARSELRRPRRALASSA